MNLHEYQGKQLFAEYGLPVSKGYAVETPQEAADAANLIGGDMWVVKAQVHAGGRGKAGGVKLVKSKEEIRDFAAKWLGNNLVTYQTDANGQPAERAISTGTGTPCRCCLKTVPKGAPFLILAARPFPKPQPYAETGPIFLCAEDCPAWQDDSLPPILHSSPTYLLKGYGPDNRIVYGTGRITPRDEVAEYAAELLGRDDVAHVDIRSASNNCFLTRMVRKESRPD